MFGIEVYGNTAKSRLEKLSKLNNKLIRILLNKKPNTHVLDLYKMMNVLPLNELYKMQLLLFAHKCIYHKELLPDIFHNYFTPMQSTHCHCTRRNNDLVMTRAKSNLGQRCSTYKASNLWNLLPADLKVNSSVNMFKKNIKRHFVQYCIENE